MWSVGSVLADLLWLYLLALIARIVMDYVVVFSHGYRPSGAVAVIFEFVYTITDPPLRVLRKIIPPLRIGNAAIDLGFLVLFIVIQVLIGIVSRY